MEEVVITLILTGLILFVMFSGVIFVFFCNKKDKVTKIEPKIEVIVDDIPTYTDNKYDFMQKTYGAEKSHENKFFSNIPIVESIILPKRESTYPGTFSKSIRNPLLTRSFSNSL